MDRCKTFGRRLNLREIVAILKLDYVLAPSRYGGLPEEEDDFDFAERFAALKAEFEAQLQEWAKLNQAIAENLAKVKIPEGKEP
jgi:type I restriction enzyme M protein